jgi:hypothetical protein
VRTCASGCYSTASGFFTNASGKYSIASGNRTTASGYYFASVHNGLYNNIGNSTCSAYANYGVVLNGNANNTTGGSWSGTNWLLPPTPADSGCYSFIGNGFQNRASSRFSSVLNGYCNTSSSTYTIASGFCSTASCDYSIALGNCIISSSFHSFALGRNTTASGCYSTASGYYTIASGCYSTASGSRTTASGYYSTASGFCTTASNYFSTASGISTTASGNYSNASGFCTTASGIHSTASGSYTTASSKYSSASGKSTTASGYYSTALGKSTTASDDYTLAQGLFSCASQFGQRSWANGSFSGTATDQQQVQYNLSNTTSSTTPAFIFLKGGSAGEISIKPNSMMLLDVFTSGIETTGNNVASSQDYVVIKNVAGTTTIVHQSNIKQHYSAGGLGITISANNTTDSLQIQVTGTSTTMRWVSYVTGIETLYAT